MSPVNELITELYVGYFNRAPDPEGLNYWIDRLNGGMPLLDIAQSFSVQAEARDAYNFLAAPSLGSPDGFLNSVYQNLFNRPIEPGGLNYWKGELMTGKSVGRMIVDIISGSQGADRTIVDNKTSVGQIYANRVEDYPGNAYSLSGARQALADVDVTTASVSRSQAILNAILTTDLTITFNDPTGTLAPFQEAIRKGVNAAWDLWEAHFTRTAPIEVEIGFKPGGPGTLGGASSPLVLTGETFLNKLVMRSNTAHEIITGIDSNGDSVDCTILLTEDELSHLVFRTSLNDLLPTNKLDSILVFAHEFGHILGFQSAIGYNLGNQIITFDRFITSPDNPRFFGPNVVAVNGGNTAELTYGKQVSATLREAPHHLTGAVMSIMGPTTIDSHYETNGLPLLDLAVLQDLGLPMTVLSAGGLERVDI